MKRAALCALLVASIGAATAGQAVAMVAPACAAHLVGAVSPTGSCSFQTNSGWSYVSVEPVASTVTATVSCVTSYGYTSSSSQTFSSAGTWFARAVGYCTLTLSSSSPTAVATGTAAPWEPIYGEPL